MSKFQTPCPFRCFVLTAAVWMVASALSFGAQHEGPKFVDVSGEFGVQLTGSAACWADLNHDGWPELCAGGTIWKNESGKSFSRLAEGLGEVVAADFDNDGFVDLFSWSTFQLIKNQNGEKFVPVALPELPTSVSLGACWCDLNGDGFVDLYVGGYEDWENQITYPDLVLWNESGTKFRLDRGTSQFRARGVTACDFDQDGDPDIYVSNYRLQPNLLWVNDGTGKLNNAAIRLNAVATSEGFAGGHSIGSAWADFDNDGLMDLFAGNFAHRDQRGDQPQSRFLKNLGESKDYSFEDKGTCGVFYQESYASPAAGDFDNDGDVDLFFTTVYGTASFGRKNNPVLFRNDGDFAFVDITADAQLGDLPPTYQAAWADFDRDGRLDLVTANKLFRNVGHEGNWLIVQVVGDGKTVNGSAIGTVAKIALPGQTLTRQVEAGTGQGNQNHLAMHFGLGNHAAKVELEITWPSGATQKIQLDVNQVVTVRLGE